ncbi:MAG: 50S ribosomal protein L6 [Bdellovibrionaceae bacterium]|nr:50S ribosomal protein L6 [Pseudobdellovibrionaceae bacterium]
MSRIGKQIIKLEKGIEISLSDRKILIKSGSKSLEVPLPVNLDLKIEKDTASLIRTSEDKKTRSLHGLTRALLQNAVTGLSKGWSKSLELNGVGYRAVLSGKNLELNLGFSHPIVYKIPEGIEIKIEKQTKVHITGADKELVGLTAHQIRSYRPVEPYLAKGVKYSDEQVRKKAGKSGGGGEKK